ncbi:MAG: triose-phosphate isomerase [Bacteroidetes bacterium]|nr:triose-phosphate isomerase [Bacteroidota bacterium]
MKRKKIVAGNWKMNLNYAEAMALTDAIAGRMNENQETEVIVSPPFLFLHEVASQLKDKAMISVAAQNCSDKNSGAFTGEVSPPMIASIGVDYVIIGHSERRKYFYEDNLLLAEKVKGALRNSLLPVYCCGETLEQRNSGKHVNVVKQQIEEGLFHLDKMQMEECVIAYEPVWAIGTGVNATPQQAQEMHAMIRKLISGKYGEKTAESISILYGGSVTPANAEELFNCKDVDGGLVGGASLKADDFLRIIDAMEKVLSRE